MEIVLMVNSECNAKCKHCYLPYNNSRTPKNALDTTTQLQEHGHKVIIAGSEALLNTDYLSAYKQAGQKYLLTNGILLDKNKTLYDKLHYAWH